MKTKSALLATLVLPLLIVACDRDDGAVASRKTEEHQAMAPDKTLESAPPAAGTPAPAPSNTPADTTIPMQPAAPSSTEPPPAPPSNPSGTDTPSGGSGKSSY